MVEENTPKVSVVMSVYKEPVEWLRESIESILNQTFKDFEFIIICDNPDYKEGIELLEAYKEKDKRIKLIANEHNIGLTRSLNIGIKESRGKYIVRMDADDYSFPHRFEKQVAFMEKHPEIVASGTGAYWWKNGDRLRRAHRVSDSTVLRSLSVFESPIFHPSAIFLREIEGENVRYNESFKYSQDYALWISLLKMSDVANLQDRLIKYRITDSQISSAHHVEQQQFAFENQLRALANIGIVLGEKDSSLFKSLTRPAASTCSFTHKEVRDFIVRFLNGNKVNLSVGYRVVKNRLILIYANRIAHSLSLPHALCSLLELQILTNTINFYSILSLVNKYRVKLNAK